MSEVRLASAAAAEPLRQARSSSIEPIFLPNPERTGPRRVAALLGVAAALLGIGLTALMASFMSGMPTDGPPVDPEGKIRVGTGIHVGVVKRKSAPSRRDLVGHGLASEARAVAPFTHCSARWLCVCDRAHATSAASGTDSPIDAEAREHRQ